MAKWLRLSLILSLALNAILIAGLFWGRNCVRTMYFKLAALNAQTEVKLMEHILKELESGDPNRIESLNIFLKRNIKQGKETAATWEKVSSK